MKGRPAWTDEQREEALRIAREHGAAEAGRRLGIPAATIRAWRHRSGEAGPPSSADPLDWATQKEAGAAEAWAGAQEALKRCRELIEDKNGDPRKAQSASVVYGVLVDKAAVLERASGESGARRAEIDRATAMRVVELIERVLADLGVPLDQAARKVLAAHLRGSEPAAEELAAAQREIRTALAAALAAEHLTEPHPALATTLPLPALPAPGDTHDAKEDTMIGPLRRIRTLREQRRRRAEPAEPEPEVAPESEVGVLVGEIEETPAEPREREAALHWHEEAWRGEHRREGWAPDD